MNDTSGPTSGTQFATYDHESQSWKMWPGTGLWGLIEYSGTWPKTGCVHGGAAYELPTLVLRTTANGYSYLPTPKANDFRDNNSPSEARRKDPALTAVSVHFPDGEVQESTKPLVEEWEAETRSAPTPTRLNSNDGPQLNAEFAEWLMGLPAGHVTAVPGLSRADQLKAIGNGVCPPQAYRALEILTSIADTHRRQKAPAVASHDQPGPHQHPSKAN